MSRTKTIHTPPEESHLSTITFPSAKIAEFGRVDPASGWIKFRCSLPKGFEKLFELMGWDIPGEKTVSEKLDGKLTGGHMILTSKDKLVDAEVDIEFESITGFECLRLELENRKGKGFRRELRFKAQFKCVDGAANLENYMMQTDNARGSLKVSYLREAVQPELPMDTPEEQITIPDVHATAAQREAVSDLGNNTLASVREIGSKRGRLADSTAN